jgi:hypothetical protein
VFLSTSHPHFRPSPGPDIREVLSAVGKLDLIAGCSLSSAKVHGMGFCYVDIA